MPTGDPWTYLPGIGELGGSSCHKQLSAMASKTEQHDTGSRVEEEVEG